MTPYCILLCHVLPHKTELQCLRLRISQGTQVNQTLEAIPYLDQRTFHDQNGPQKPHLLEVF